MTRDEILEYFKDINHAYNDCTRHDTLKRMIDELQSPCTDAISRAEALSHAKTEWGNGHEQPFDYVEVDVIKQLPPVKPQYTDAEIQKMQDLEFAEIQKAYEIGKAEGSEVLDKIRAELHATAEMHEDGNYYLREEWIDEIFDKYRAERSDKE